MATEYRKGLNLFALLVAGIGLVVGLGMAWLRVDAGDSAWLFAVPVVLAPIAYGFLIRRREERVMPTTTRGYTMHTPTFVDRSLSELLSKVRAHGYQIDAFDVSKGAVAAADAPLRNCELRLTEQRAPADYGEIALRLTVQQSGAVLGYLEATDSQPGFYDEMAQFVIAEMGELWDDLEFTHSAGGERRPATELRAELPKPPYGLSLLPQAAASGTQTR